jgi:hypothetical protein
VSTDWLDWHAEYDDPGSSLARRLRVVREYTRRALDDGDVRHLLSICAGDGRDVLPVLAGHDRGRDVRALLIELDPELSRRARAAAAALPGVTVLTADAGAADTYLGAPPADLLLACGVFGNVGPGDARRTVAALPGLLAGGGTVIWTRGRGDDGHDPSTDVRAWLGKEGFTELAFTCPPDARFRVGMHRLEAKTAGARPAAGSRLFTFR